MSRMVGAVDLRGFSHNRAASYRRSREPSKCFVACATADIGLAEASSTSSQGVLIEEEVPAYGKVNYNWETEWYPLYLANEVPRDAPLGLTVFDRQLVLYYDGNGEPRCYEDCCPHRLAKLSEGQIIDGRLECLYHGWQFHGDGKCVKIPQLPAGAQVPRAACVRSYAVQVSQGVMWVWMSDKDTADLKKIPHFEHFDKPGFFEIASIHELPYDHSILLENLMDPAHVPISHDRTDLSAKRENAQPLNFEIVERTERGFVGRWGESSKGTMPYVSRFEAPCVFRNDSTTVGKDGNEVVFSAVFLCRPAGHGKSMLIVRFGTTIKRAVMTIIPKWLVHRVSNKVFEQDMGFLAAQNEALERKGKPTSELYLNHKYSDVFVMEYRKWLDKVGHGMPYYIGHRTLSLSSKAPILEAAPAGTMAASASSKPVKGALGMPYAPDPTNRYFRHVIHCTACRRALSNFKTLKKTSYIIACLCMGLGIVIYRTPLKIALVVLALVAMIGSYACQYGVELLTRNETRPHRA